MGILYILEETVTILENPLQYLYILRPVTDLAQVLWSSYKLGKGHLLTDFQTRGPFTGLVVFTAEKESRTGPLTGFSDGRLQA